MILLKENRQKDVVLLFFGHSDEPCPETSTATHTAASQSLASVELLMKEITQKSGNSESCATHFSSYFTKFDSQKLQMISAC